MKRIIYQYNFIEKILYVSLNFCEYFFENIGHGIGAIFKIENFTHNMASFQMKFFTLSLRSQYYKYKLGKIIK